MAGIENQDKTEELKNTNDAVESWVNELKNIETDNKAWEKIASWLNEANISIPEIQTTYESEFAQPENNEFLESVEYSPEEYQNIKFEIISILRTSLNATGYKREWNKVLGRTYEKTSYKDKKAIARYWENFVDTDTIVAFNTTDKLNTYNADTIKSWIIDYNTKLAKDQLFVDSWRGNKVAINKEYEKWLSQKRPINVEAFMKHFNEEQKAALTIYEDKTIYEAISIEPRSKDQKIGKFVMTPKAKQQIVDNFQKSTNILELTITGKADATLPETEKPNEKVNEIKKILKEKWLSTNIQNVELENGTIISTEEFLNSPDDKNKLNQTWAYARALMQIESLPTAQIQKINNCPSFKIKINAQDINNGKKWDEYTGGWIEMKSDGNTKIVKKPIGMKEPNNEIPNAEVNLWIISFNTTIWLSKNINISLNKDWKLKLSEYDKWWIWSAASWFWSNDVHSRIDWSILYNENKVPELKSSKHIWIAAQSTWYNNLSITWTSINQNLDLEKDLWLNIKRDVAWSWGYHSEGIKRNSFKWEEFDKNFSEYLSNIEKNPDKFIALLNNFIKDQNINKAQKTYLKKVIKNIKDAQNLSS